MNTSVDPVRPGTITRFLPLLACSFLLFCSSGAFAVTAVQNSDVVVSLDTSTTSTAGAITVTDKGSPAIVWTQMPAGGTYAVSNISHTSTSITATITGLGGPYGIVINLGVARKGFHLTVTPPSQNSDPNYPYTTLPLYPFMFTQSDGGGNWYYVQNNGGEGTLMPLPDTNGAIRGRGGWTGGQPWWGVTNLTQAMMARLDSFVRIQNPTSTADPSAYKIPLEIEYSFYRTGGYVTLAKAYRQYYLGLQPGGTLPTLTARAATNPDVGFLKDSTYAYFWDDFADAFEGLATDMKAAGLNRVIAMFNLNGEDPQMPRLTKPMLDCIAGAFPCAGAIPWKGGMYRTPTPNLDKIVDLPPPDSDWVGALLLGSRTQQYVIDNNRNGNTMWDQLYSPTVENQWQNSVPKSDSGLPYINTTYGANLRFIYHDTLPQQLGPSIYGPNYLESIEDNRTGRQAVLEITRNFQGLSTNHYVAGSGEGISAWWTVPHLDYWEGGMEESTYGDINRHPIMDHCYEFADDKFPCGDGGGQGEDTCNLHDTPADICSDTHQESWKAEEEKCLVETTVSLLPGARIPLLALQWHNYVAETWNWRDSTFVVSSLSWKKDLFNILYGAMPMWHVNSTLWAAHKDEYIFSYETLLPVRKANGFAEMTDHHWVNDDPTQEVQYTYWDNGNHVIVNFGGMPYTFTDPVYGSVNVPAEGYAMLPNPVSEYCEGTGTPTGWTNSGSSGGVDWDYTAVHLEGNQSLRFNKTGSGSTRVDFTNRAEVWIYFKVRLTNAALSSRTLGGLAANGDPSINQRFQINSSGKPSFGGAQTVDGFSLDTTYDVWLHYRAATIAGLNNGVVEIGFSTDGTKPTSGSKFAQLTYAGNANAGRLFLGPGATSTFDTIFDSISTPQ